MSYFTGRTLYKSKGEKNWDERFCTLDGNLFSMYTSNEKEKLICQFNIEPYANIKSNFENQRYEVIIKSHFNNLTLSFLTKEESNQWISALKSCVKQIPLMSLDCFNAVTVLGRGYYGKVTLVEEKATGCLYALKSIRKELLVECQKVHSVISEKNCLLRAHHPFIVQLCFAFQTQAKFYLGLEYAPGGELFRHMEIRGALGKDEVKLYVAEIALALSHLHSLGIVYRDLKPENVMLDADGHVKLTDFGLSKDISIDGGTETLCGTTEYLAPEIALGRIYDYSVDWWALGILMFEMLTDSTPFADQNRNITLKHIIHSQPLIPHFVDAECKEVIIGLLQKEPTKRAKLEDLKGMKLFKDMDFDQVLARGYRPSFVPGADPKLNFDPVFTRERAVDSPAAAFSGDFPGFSFPGMAEIASPIAA